MEEERAFRSCKDAILLPDGSFILGVFSFGSMVRVRSGLGEELLPAHQTSGEAKLDPTGRYVAYGYPLAWDGDYLLRAGVGVYDLEGNSGTLLAD